MTKRYWVVLLGFIATAAVAVYMVARLTAQGATVSGDFSNATIAEVRDAQGEVVLRGQFVPVEEDDEDIERKATLQATGTDADASGEAEVETSKERPADQEIEFSIRHVQSGASFAFMIDGQQVGTATSDSQGRAEIELDVSRRP